MFLSLLLAAGLSFRQAQPDTLQAVTVVADRGVVVSRTDTLKINSLQDDAAILQQLPGLYVGDYGGPSALKSVSLRGFGSAHTILYLDGVRVNNVQSGQADLGMLDWGSLSAVVADYAQNSLSFQTARPVFGDKPVSGLVRLQGGSWGTWQPYARLNFRMDQRWTLSAHAGAKLTAGNFPLADGTLRSNNDLKQLQGGLDLFGALEGGDFHAKVMFNGADRGTPGSLSWPSTDRQKDRNYLGQWVLRKSFSPLYTLHFSGKTAYDDLQYRSSWGDSRYEQVDFQLNSAHRFQLKPWWSLSIAADLAIDGISSELYTHSRIGTVVSAATAFRLPRFRADVALEYAGTFDGGTAWNRLSPSADVRFTLTPGLDLVAFGRRACRIPTFNELYYPGYGNPSLKSEDAWLTDLGLDGQRSIGPWTLKARAEGYYNFLNNKIISAPSVDNPTIWLPYNIGKVQAYGADVQAGFAFARRRWQAGMDVRYGWQKALDKTPDSDSFNMQIPYVARHSLSVSGNAGWNGWVLSAVYTLRAGRQDAAGAMPDWDTLDATFSKEFPIGSTRLGLHVTGRNLLDKRYEIVSGYPMPGRSILGGFNFAF